MKTAISIPDDVFADVDRWVAAHGTSRSEFFTTAARRYLDDLDKASLTEQINAALDLIGEDESTRAAVEAGRRRLAAEDDDW